MPDMQLVSIAAGAAMITFSQMEPPSTADYWLLGVGIFLVGFGAHL
jgi:hypothetical protein